MQATYDFMVAVRKIKPEVLRDLRDSVPAEQRRVGSVVIIPGNFSPALIAWAERHGLSSSKPILQWADRTVQQWARRRSKFKGVTFPRPTAIVLPWEPAMENPDDPLSPVGAQPSTEKLRKYLARATFHYRTREEADRRSRKGVKIRSEHFEWLARRLYRGERDQDIATSDGVTVDAVHKGIVSAVRALQLKGRPAGRPRKRR